MKQKLTINAVDFTPYIQEGGITFNTISRVVRAVTTLSGELIQKEVHKRGMTVSLIETITDTHLNALVDALDTSPATALYTDRDGIEHTGTFYVFNLSASAKKVIGDTTFYTGVSFDLEER